MRINKKYIAIILLICAFVPFVFNVQKVQAAYSYKSGSDVTMDKITKYNATQAIGLFNDHTDVLAVQDFLHYGLNNGFYDKDNCNSVPVPNTVMSGSDSASPTLSCWDFWYGNSNWNALIKGEKSNNDPSINDAVSYLKQLGYTQDAVDSLAGGEKCFKVAWTDPNQTSDSGNAGNFESNTLCAELDDDGYMWGARLDYGEDSKKPSPDPSRQYSLQRDSSGGVLSSYTWYVYLDSGANYDPQFRVVVEENNKGKKWTDFESELKSKLAEHNRTASGTTSNLSLVSTTANAGDVSSEITNSTSFTRNSSQKVISYSGDVLLSEAEVYNIYAKYLTNSNKVKLSCDGSYDYDGDNTYEWIPVQLKRNGKVDNTCHVREISKELYTGGQYLQGTYDPATNTLTNGAYLFNRRNMSLADIAAAVNKMNLEKLEEDIDDFTGATEDVSNGDGESSESDSCYNADIEAMSWIICPALNNTSNTVDGIEGYLRDWLQIKTVGEGGIFENSNGTHLYDGWSIFRNLANGLLIIVLLIIIFSQLTGYGIDNYGIKKMLPKLILMGILINLSFLFCQLAVDISNILGVGLDNMMKAIAANMNGGTAPNYTTSTIVTAVLGTIAGAGTVAGVAAGAIGGGGVMIAIVLLLALLVALIAVLMFFVMLSARIIIVAVFIVISPVAFALYILPNTQNIFKKWWKIFETALVIYPICGALYGASYIIKAIVGGDSGGFIPGIIAVVAPFLPFLALPTLLRGAMAGLGALGGTLTMLGNGLRKGAQSGSGAIQSGIKGSERYKNSMQDRARNRQIKMMDRGIDRLQNKRRPLTGNEELRLARMQQTQDKLRNEDRAARAIVEQNRTKDMDLSGLSKEWNDAWEAGNKEKLDAMTSVINSRYGAAGANEIAKRIATKNIANDENSQSMMKVLQNNMNHDSTLANNMRNKASDAYGMISDGGKDGNGNYQNLRHFTDNNEIAKSDKDWSTQSSATLQRAIDSGRLTKEQIKRILNSSDTSIQSGLDDDKRKVLRDAVPEFTTPVQSTPITSGNAMTDEAELNALLRQQRQNNESGNDKRSPGGVILP